jgi:hypothetical protein
MWLRVAMSGRWSYAALNPVPGKLIGRGQEMAGNHSVALSDHGVQQHELIGEVLAHRSTIRPDSCPPLRPGPLPT